MISVIGGKLTTYRRLAEEVLEALAPYLGTLRDPWTAGVPLPGGDILGGDVLVLAGALQRLWPFLTPAEGRRIARAYGTRASRWLEGATSRADLGEDFGGGMSAREADWLIREEWARTADDIQWLHSKTGLHATSADRRRLEAWLARRLSADAAA